MPNITHIKRQRMLGFINEMKERNITDDEVIITLGEIENEVLSKRFGLVWEEHEETADVMMRKSIPVFTEVPENKLTNACDEGYNFILEGDNIHSLYLLEKTHRGRIDVIYIDPPYNRGKLDFVYDDDFVDPNDGFIHSKWLSFMSKRLLLAKRLLSDQGTIFMSIDDHEQAALKMLCDDIFGVDNFVTCIPRVSKQQRSAQERHMDVSHDYVLCYSYSDDFVHIINRDIDATKVKKDHIGTYIENDTKAILADKSKGYSKGGDYDFEYNGKVYQPIDKNGIRNRWLWTKPRMEAAAKLGILVETGSSLRMRLYLDHKFDDKTNTMVPKNPNLIFHTSDFMTNSCYTNATGSSELKSIGIDLFQRFNNPKPISLIRDLIRLCDYKDDIIVLDFFAGSGTTAQAVMELNKDGGHRRFILCTNNQNEICSNVTYPRVKTVITGLRADGTVYSEGVHANVKYYKTEFISKEDENITDLLHKHIVEMIQLEHGVEIDDGKYLLILDDEEADLLESNWDKYPDLEAIYVSKDVLFTTSQNELFNSVEVFDIPDYYFSSEMKEIGESW